MAQNNSDGMCVQAKSDLMSSRLNDSCQDVIEKFTTMANNGVKIKDPHMRQWADCLLSERKDEQMVDSGSSGYSENFEFKINGFKQNPERDDESSVMSMIEHFEQLKDTSCNEHYDLREINNSSRKEVKYRTEVRQKECDFDEKVF
jgi:hypothetical protein